MNRRKLTITAILAASCAFVCTEALATTHEDKQNGAAPKKSAATPRDGSASENQTDASATVGVPVTVMVPLDFKVEPQAKGCWVELYTEESFRGDRLTLVGPLDLAKMRGPFGADWETR